MMKVIVLFTCFNRIEKTKNCIRTLAEYNPYVDFKFVAVDGGSKDGTTQWLSAQSSKYNITKLQKNGLFYSQGMRQAMLYAHENFDEQYNYVLLVNDDVNFYPNAVEKLIAQSRRQTDAVIVGSTCSADGNFTYGAVCFFKGIHYTGVGIDTPNLKCDTFNANCVLIPKKIFNAVPVIDERYIHSLGDFDYGLQISRQGYCIYSSDEYVGVCDRNSNTNTFKDKNLSRWERIKKKESVKGAPAKQWFYFLKKNFGMWKAILHSITPYLKILAGH